MHARLGENLRTLYLLRHAKSSQDDPAIADHDRPLSARGRAEASALVPWLAERGYAPTLVLCSSARRTRETLAPLAEHLDGERQVSVDRVLYLTSPGTLLERLREVDDGHAHVLVIGHNPAMEELALALASPESHSDETKRVFPSAALAVLELDAPSWSDLAPASCRLREFSTPASRSQGAAEG